MMGDRVGKARAGDDVGIADATESDARRPDAIAANRLLTRYKPDLVLALAERAAELGITFHIGGFPFGGHRESSLRSRKPAQP